MASVIKGPKKLTILHSGDWHVCDDFFKDAQNCLDFLVNQAREIRPDLIMISGDTYNHRQIRQESAAARFLSPLFGAEKEKGRRFAGAAPLSGLVVGRAYLIFLISPLASFW